MASISNKNSKYKDVTADVYRVKDEHHVWLGDPGPSVRGFKAFTICRVYKGD